MAGLVLRWLLNAAALWLTTQVVSGVRATGIAPLLLATLVLSTLNAGLRPFLLLLTLPINLLTLGLFTFVVNGFVLKLTALIVPGFAVHGFWSAVGGALILSLFSFALNLFVSDTGRIEYLYIERIDP